MSAVSQNLCLSGLDFSNSLAQGNEELRHSRNLCLSGSDFGDSQPKVTNDYGVPEISVFMHPENT